MLEVLLVLLVAAGVVWLVSTPLRERHTGAREEGEAAQRADLEAARDAKYREIRDAELDFRTGKLSDADWRAQDRVLRREAMDILQNLDRVSNSGPQMPL